MGYVTFNHISKFYHQPEKTVLKDFTLSIDEGEFIVIVGPSGSGKSTLLELICGFESITSGEIKIDGNLINDVPSKERNVAMVFQNYALLPHLTVYENIAFGMKIRKCRKQEIKEKVAWAAKLLDLEDVLNRLPKKLSGGQRQRVAIARAMVREPKLFLMDEPLSNLDAQLRDTTAQEIRNLHQRLNATTIYVTHDQTEALTLADRIVVLNQGAIQQIGTPMEIYTKPQNLFVATFLGRPQINVLDLNVLSNDCGVLSHYTSLSLTSLPLKLSTSESYFLAIRPEHIQIAPKNTGIEMRITKIDYLGGETVLYLSNDCYNLTMKSYENYDYKTGQIIFITLNLKFAHVFDKITHERIES